MRKINKCMKDAGYLHRNKTPDGLRIPLTILDKIKYLRFLKISIILDKILISNLHKLTVIKFILDL